MKIGQTVMTRGIGMKMATSWIFKNQIEEALGKFTNKDWGDIPEDDADMNNINAEMGTGSLMGAYETCEGRIWIMTEHNRSVTTILFPDEY